ncbi:MAG: MarR family transcriptional regulator, partial [Pseudomonadota bacterium]
MATIQLALLVDRLMRQIHVSLQANSAEFDTRDVGPMGGMVLLTLADTGPCDMHVLTQLMARDKSQMTRIIKALEAKDCVARETSARDARVSVISLTDIGQAVVQDLRIAL